MQNTTCGLTQIQFDRTFDDKVLITKNPQSIGKNVLFHYFNYFKQNNNLYCQINTLVVDGFKSHKFIENQSKTFHCK